MFEHHMTFVNRTNSPVNIAVMNANVIHAYKNGLEPGKSWKWTDGWPIGYDIMVFHDTAATRIAPAGHNWEVVIGYFMIGGSVATAAIAGIIEIASIGLATPFVTAAEVAAVSTFTGGLAIASVVLGAGGVGLEIIGAIMSPATLTGLFGTDNYKIEIGGNAKLVEATVTDGQLTAGIVDYDPISLKWKNETSGTSGKVGTFLWVWARNPKKGKVKDIAVMPDGSIMGVRMDNRLWTRPDLSTNWSAVPNSQFMVAGSHDGEGDHAATLRSIAAGPHGEIYGLFTHVNRSTDKQLRVLRQPGSSTWELVPLTAKDLKDAKSIYCDATYLGVIRNGFVQKFDIATFKPLPESPDVGLGAAEYIAFSAQRAVGLAIDKNKHVCPITRQKFGSMMLGKAGDDRKLIAVDQLPSGHPIAVDEDHHLLFGAVFNKALLATR